MDYGTKYCHESPTLPEGPLQDAILSAINSVMSRKAVLVGQIADAIRMELAPVPGEGMSLADIDRRLGELDREFQALFSASKAEGGYLAHADDFKRITEDLAALKEKKAAILEQQNSNSAANRRIEDAVGIFNAGSSEITEWNEGTIRQLVDTVKVLSADRIMVYLKGGMEIEQTIEGG